jgi:dTDP-4-amino-4,6-dideoxygalactose transaminase
MPEVPFYSLEPQHKELRDEILGSITTVYDKNTFILGSLVEAFEVNYAKYLGVTHCAGVGNGFDALVLCLRALGIRPGDEVLVPSHTYIATWLAVSAVGATIVPVEPDVATCNIDCAKLESLITKKSRAVIPVHLYGQSCDMGQIVSIARSHDLFIIEDNAQAHGAMFRDQKTGSIGDCNATSFYPVKILGALGDGGAVTTKNSALIEDVRAMRNHGATQRPYHDHTGINSRLDEIQAAVLNVKLKIMDRLVRERQELAAFYLKALQGIGDLILPVTRQECTHVYHLFVIRTSRRDKLAAFLRQKGIETAVHYPLAPHMQKAYASLGCTASSFPIAKEISETCLSLPLWPGMAQDQLDWVCDSIKVFWK